MVIRSARREYTTMSLPEPSREFDASRFWSMLSIATTATAAACIFWLIFGIISNYTIDAQARESISTVRGSIKNLDSSELTRRLKPLTLESIPPDANIDRDEEGWRIQYTVSWLLSTRCITISVNPGGFGNKKNSIYTIVELECSPLVISNLA